MYPILAFSDLHFPWHSKIAMGGVLHGIRKYRPKTVVCLGDLYDQFSFSRFMHTQSLYTPKDEIVTARKYAEKLWFQIGRAVPKAKLFQLRGNHDERVVARLLGRAPELEYFADFDSIYTFDGVETLASERDELILRGIVFQHGFKTKLGDHCRQNLMRTVVGHSHRPGIYYLPLKGEVVWELNVGHCADRHAQPMSYTKQRQLSTWTKGFGVIDKYGPRFITL